MLSLLNTIEKSIEIRESENVKENIGEVEEVVEENKDEEKISPEKELLEKIHSFPRMRNDFPIIDDEVLSILVDPTRKATITKKHTAKKIAERLKLEEEQYEAEKEKVIDKTEAITQDEEILEEAKNLETKEKEFEVLGEIDEEAKELIGKIYKAKTNEPFTTFNSEIKLLDDKTIECAGEILYQVMYMKDIVVKNSTGKEHILKKDSTGGYVSKDAFIGENVGIWRGVRVLGGAVIDEKILLSNNTTEVGEETIIAPFTKVMNKEKEFKILKTQQQIIDANFCKKRFSVLDND